MELINLLEEYTTNNNGVNANDNKADAMTNYTSNREKSTNINTIP